MYLLQRPEKSTEVTDISLTDIPIVRYHNPIYKHGFGKDLLLQPCLLTYLLSIINTLPAIENFLTCSNV